ncbi:MAG: intermembrane transport protein PqiB [Prosthecobacter sp.]
MSAPEPQKPDPVPAPAPAEPPRAVVRRSRRWSSVWIVPVTAILLAGWMVWQHYHDVGPLALVRFSTADSIVSGKTEVRCRSVRVGVVEQVQLAADLQSVVVSLRIDVGAEGLLRGGTRFWVVRPRISAANISGLGTIITGSYIEMDPGDGLQGVHHFESLELPPVTASNVPGLRLTLLADTGGSLAVGSPLYYRGFDVGRVETRTFDIEKEQVRFDVFIREEHARLVTRGTSFWNTSGIDVSAGSEGFRIRTPALQALLAGGASFAVLDGGVAGEPAKNGDVFKLYASETEAEAAQFNPDHVLLLLFEQSVRGLKKGAPVEFRGLNLGRVVDVSFKYTPSDTLRKDPRVPVLVELDLRPLRTTGQKREDEDAILAEAVKNGLRAKLGTGSLLTGALFIDIDFVADAPPAEMAKLGEFDVMPTQSSGLVQLEAKVNAILAKIEALPLDETLGKFGRTADEITKTVAEARGALDAAHKLLASEKTQNLTAEMDATLKQLRASVKSLGPEGSVQGDLQRTLDELRAALRAFKALSDGVAEKPNSLIFGRKETGNPMPRAKRPSP